MVAYIGTGLGPETILIEDSNISLSNHLIFNDQLTFFFVQE